jgi:glycosyltransferase involved in cell wall biosynthesis
MKLAPIGPDALDARSNPELLISVIICTHNRADYLVKAISSVLDQNMSRSKYEIVVVDNGSTDNTAEVVRTFSSAGSLHYIFEEQLGLCRARNTGWRCARGRYVAYLDDDAIASPGWLTAVEQAFTIAPDAGAVGGRVDPIWEVARPGWLSDDIAKGLTIVDWSDSPKFIADVHLEWLVGANMSVPVAVLQEIGGFHPRLDRVGTHMLSGGDVFLQMQVLRRGYSCFYHPQMAVRHLVPKSRVQKRWFFRRYYWQGVSDAIMQLIDKSPSRMERLQLAGRQTLNLLQSPWKLMNLIIPCAEPKRFTAKCFTLIIVGHIAGLLRDFRS